MGKSPLILAALANGAAPSLNIVKVQKSELLANADYDGALLTTDDGKHYVVRIAKTAAAETNQEVELRALKALAKNGSLPFDITSQLAQNTTRDGENVRVLNYVYGSNFEPAELGANDPLVESIAKAIAAIHNLPLSVVQDIDFPEYTPSNILQSVTAELDRAMETGKISPVLLNRWNSALENEGLFRFMPTVINAMLSADSVLELDGEVSGILDWTDLQIGDPARDFAWLLASGHDDLIYNLMLAYQAARPNADANIRQRAQLYFELSWASYLLTGVRANDDEIVMNAQGELDRMAAEVEAGTALRLTPTGFAEQQPASSFAASPASVFDETPAASFSLSGETATQTGTETAAEPEPVFTSYNFDKPLVDFSPEFGAEASAAFDDTATAPIEIVEVTAAEVETESAPTPKSQTHELPPFLAGDLPSFLIDEELDNNAKEDAKNVDTKDDLF